MKDGTEIPNVEITLSTPSIQLFLLRAEAAPTKIPETKPMIRACTPNCTETPKRCEIKRDTGWLIDW